MRQEALGQPGVQSRRDLPHGLTLILIYRPPTRMQLSLIRAGVWPSESEVKTVIRHFGYIPDNAAQERRQERKNETEYHIIRLLWDEGDQLTLLPADTSARLNYYQENL